MRIKYYDVDTAKEVLKHWPGDENTLQHLANSGNSVFKFEHENQTFVLRLSGTNYRTIEENEQEMDFQNHLYESSIQVAKPIRSNNGQFVETIDDGSANVMTWAPGERITPESSLWNESFFKAWGRHLGEIHLAAQSYKGPVRWQWDEDIFLSEGLQSILAEDVEIKNAWRSVLDQINILQKTSDVYGVIHQDFGPQNFNYDADLGLTSFDYGNCCHHWFVYDIIIGLTTLWRMDDREKYRDWILAGYREVFDINSTIWEHAPAFFRLRLLYVYGSRLWAFGESLAEDQKQALRQLALSDHEWMNSA